jgi:small-conductance mechanosensitive channel
MDPLRQAGRGFLGYLPKLFFLIVIIILTRFVLNILKLFFNGLQNGAIVIQNFYPDWAMPAFQIIRFMVIILAVVMAFPYIPFSDTGAFQGISVFVGLLLSLGSSSFISNIIAGYSMTFRRAFMKGDRIKINDTIGTVESQSLMVTGSDRSRMKKSSSRIRC